MARADIKGHGVDLGKQLAVMGMAIGILVGLSKLGMCAPPWQTPVKSTEQHKEITENERIQLKAAQIINENKRKEIRIEEKEKHHEVKSGLEKIREKIDRMYYWQATDRRNRDE